jgi:aminomethyltransferase
LLTCPIASLDSGQIRYGLICNQDGGCVDDVTVYRRSQNDFFLCVNAATREGDLRWIEAHATQDCEILDQSDSTGLLAIQGPESARILEALLDPEDPHKPSTLGRFRSGLWRWQGCPLLISRTGYTGSDGFEIYLTAADTPSFFENLMAVGAPLGLVPAGLGARDTLRLEAALPLYGHELDEDTTPLEAGLARFVKRKRGGFIGHDAMERRATEPDRPCLIGFELLDRGVARAGHEISAEGHVVGRVTSGAPTPTLGKSIGLGYVPHPFAETGTELEVNVRGRRLAVRRVKRPFVSKA